MYQLMFSLLTLAGRSHLILKLSTKTEGGASEVPTAHLQGAEFV